MRAQHFLHCSIVRAGFKPALFAFIKTLRAALRAARFASLRARRSNPERQKE
jgi:hypothetical protein